MWFRQAIAYQFEGLSNLDLEKAFGEFALKPCPPHARQTFGWSENPSGNYWHAIAGFATTRFCKEERILPKSVLHQQLQEKLTVLEQEKGRKLRRKEQLEILENLEFDLLPKAFVIQKALPMLWDLNNKRLIIQASSESALAPLFALLRKTLPSVQYQRLVPDIPLAQTMTAWLRAPWSLGSDFSLAERCVLVTQDEQSKKLSCRGYDLNAKELQGILSNEHEAEELALHFNERLAFSVTDRFVLKSIKPLDYLEDSRKDIDHLEPEAQFDANLSLFAGEITSLINRLLAVCNRMPEENAPPQHRTMPEETPF